MGQIFTQKYKNNIRTVLGAVGTPFQDDVTLLCDTALNPVSMTLLDIPKDYWSTQYKLYVIDKSNNASVKNITINAPVGFKINGASSVVINTNGGSVILRVGSNTDYIALCCAGGGGAPTPFAVKITTPLT